MPTTPDTILALDVGDKRVGVARASLTARLAQPVTTLERGDGFFEELREIISSQQVCRLVAGLPRGLDGQATAQTALTEQFVEQLRDEIDLPVELQDEALTSRKAEAELQRRGKTYQRADVDALAATFILEDYLTARPASQAEEAAA